MAKEKQTRRMIAMALAAAVTVTAVPVDALAASPYAKKMARHQAKQAAAEAKKSAVSKEEYYKAIDILVKIPEDVTVDVPLTDADDPATDVIENKNEVTFSDPAGTVTGDPPADENDKNYDYTEVTQQGKVTIETTDVTITETEGGSDMDYVSDETDPSATNDLVTEIPSAAPEDYVPTGDPENGYQYEYAGTGSTSQLRPALVFTEPMTDEEKIEKWGDHAYIKSSYSELWVNFLEDPTRAARDENGKLVKDAEGYVLDTEGNRILKEEFSTIGPDGKKYYMHRIDNLGEGIFSEGWYSDGEWHADLNAPADKDDEGNPVLKTVQLVDQDGNPILDENDQPIFVEVGKINKWANSKNEYGTISGPYGGLIKDKDGNVMVNYMTVWAGAQHFVLVDKETGEVITTYCADISTPTQDGFQYNVENLEDASYYNEAQAELIRSIALNGYWGTVGYQTDEDGNTLLDDNGDPVPKAGSLEAMKNMLAASGQFTAEELESLTDGVALTATQMAIWSCSNHMAGAEFVNSHYYGTPDQVEVNGTGAGDVPADKEDEVKLMMKLYDYLKALEPTSYEGEETTANTIINADNFVESMNVTVIEKVKDHENNLDDDTDNDAYTTNLSFALVVTPSTENGDDLVVSVVSNGQVLATGRIAGVNEEGEDYDTLTPDKNGNYTFSNIVMTEGEQNFNITMDGIQNLKEGVYLYSSEVRVDDAGDDVSSQTLVGIANGKHSVDVEMNITFELDVDDNLVARERRSHGGGGGNNGGGDNPPGTNPPDGETNIPDEDVPLSDVPELDDPEEPVVDIEEGDVPMADAPEEPLVAGEEESIIAETGDSNHMAAGFAGMLAALAGLFGLRRKEN